MRVTPDFVGLSPPTAGLLAAGLRLIPGLSCPTAHLVLNSAELPFIGVPAALSPFSRTTPVKFLAPVSAVGQSKQYSNINIRFNQSKPNLLLRNHAKLLHFSCGLAVIRGNYL